MELREKYECAGVFFNVGIETPEYPCKKSYKIKLKHLISISPSHMKGQLDLTSFKSKKRP